ncbi:hypothetical protein K458DRAFT_383746 [Lentithecium fluviatile CBS 122367]|uniref:Uncharacterized protein n=1 Tax=Lentithecium fluviatile CBS 122367 TaxID=1168545 RepID=A0A6G1JFY3_9PLEO|nr:hypothetical protein K458DRAFT_383746 [Lentithecium fluviatile CBS 122367]
MTTAQTVRRVILTGSVAAVTVAGTVYGAQLKSGWERARERERLEKATPEEIIAQLRAAQADLEQRKHDIERRIAAFKVRQSGEGEQQGQGRGRGR